MTARSLLISLAVLFLITGCGFQPLHGRGQTAAQLDGIRIELIKDRLGQLIRNELLELMPDSRGTAPYVLRVEAVEKVNKQSVTQDNEVTLAYVVVTGRYQLIRSEDGGIVASGELQSQTAFDLIDAPYAEITAMRTARRFLARDIARNLHTRLAVAMPRTRRP